MTKHGFWTLIEEAHRQSHGRAAAQTEYLIEVLAGQPIEEIVSFAQWFNYLMGRADTYGLLAAHYLVLDGCHSGDGFEYFRGWLVGQGRAVFAAAVADADSLADRLSDETNPGESTDGESLVYVAKLAAKAKLGDARVEEDMALDDAMYERPPQLGADDIYTPGDDPRIDDADAAKHLPRLAARVEALWTRESERPKNLVKSPQPDGSTVFYYPTTLRVAFALGSDGRPIPGVGDVL